MLNNNSSSICSRKSSNSSPDQTSAKKINPKRKLEKEQKFEVIPLEIEKSVARISKNKKKDPKFSQNLRWIRDNEQNRGVLFDYIIKKVLIGKMVKGDNWTYLPCCNSFSRQKPQGSGHKGTKWNPLLFLLEEPERTKVLTFKKKLRLKLTNSAVPKKEHKNVMRAKLLTYIKAEIELKKLREITKGLPLKDNCFHLPLIVEKSKEDCPGMCPLLLSKEPLDFKVDLVTIDPVFSDDQLDFSSPSTIQKQPKGKGSGGKHLKRLKVCSQPGQGNRQQEKPHTYPTLPPISQEYFQKFPFTDSKRGKQEDSQAQDGKVLGIFGLSPGTRANFEVWSKQTESHKGSLFDESRSSSPYSPHRSSSPNQQMGKLQSQVENLKLGPQESWLQHAPKLRKAPNFFGNFLSGFNTQQNPTIQGISRMTEMEKNQRLNQLALLHQQKQNELQQATYQIRVIEQNIQREEKNIAMIDEEIEKLIQIVNQKRKEGSEFKSEIDSQ